MKLEGKKVKLRALEPEDLELLYSWENDTSNWDISGTLTPYSKYILDQYLASSHQDIYTGRQLRLMIVKNDLSERCIGCIDLFDFDPKNKKAGAGILIGSEDERGKGYGFEAMQLLLGYGLQTLDLHQIYANIMVGNEPSLKLFQKLGFEITGTKKDWIYSKGEWKDEYLLQYISR
jgi:diamine N-acetyltransferase